MNNRKRLLLIFCTAVLGAVGAAPARGGNVYVSLHGNDANDGVGPDAKHALRTIQAGVNRLQPGDTLWIRGGNYRETVTVMSSGAPGKPLTLRPYRDEKVVVSGCDPITGWVRHEGNIWKAPMAWTLGKGRNQVFSAGEVMIEARYPNRAAPGLEMYVSGLSPLWPTFGHFSIADPEKHPNRIVSKLLEGQPDNYWKGAVYYGVHYQGWCAQTGIIESSKSGQIVVGDRTRTWWFPGEHSKYKPEEGRGMIVGHMHALDRPGEWHWQDNMLYLIPAGAGPPVDVEAKRRQLALDLSGRRYIRIIGLHIRGASVRMEDSAHCLFDGCDLSYIAHFTRQYSIGQVELDHDTILSGETGIYVSGHDNAFLNCRICYSAGAGFHLRGYHQTIHNCLIDEVDYTAHYLNAITDAVSDFAQYENQLVGGHVITFNTMRNAGRHFFNFYGNGTSKLSRDRAPMDYMATLFAHNHLYNGMLQTKDAGFLTGYYSSGGTLNHLHSQVLCNVLHDSYDVFAMRIHKLGIVYLDAGTCNVDLRHNLLWAAPGSLQQGMWFNTACVGIRESDNVFHSDFVRTCKQLRPGDFPSGKPFRFGHDFAHPPSVPQWPPLARTRIEAEACTKRSSGLAPSGPVVGGLRDGQWLCLGTRDFDQGWQSAVLCFASDVKAMNTDRSARRPPRHTKRTDPLVFEAVVNDGMADGIHRQWDFIYNVKDGVWVRYRDVPVGEGYGRVRVVYGSIESEQRRVEVHIDAPDGPVIGRVALTRTDHKRDGRIQIYGQATGPLATGTRGRHDIYFVFRSANKRPVGQFTYFRFERYRGEIPLQKNEVKLELRLDSPDGEKFGTFYPSATGAPDKFRWFVAKLEPVRGRREAYLVVRSNVAKPVGAIDWIRFEKATSAAKIVGIGLPPRRDEAGHWIFPEPTHRPRAKPANNYP